MVDREEARLKEMGLTKLNEKDLFLTHDDDWESRGTLHNDLKNSNLITKKPFGNYFEFEENSEDKEYIPCHLMIPVVVIKTKTLVSQSAFLESEESEENEDEDEIDIDADDGPSQAESSSSKKSKKKNTTKNVEPPKNSEPAKKDDLRQIELKADYDWAVEEATLWNMEHMRFDELARHFQTCLRSGYIPRSKLLRICTFLCEECRRKIQN